MTCSPRPRGWSLLNQVSVPVNGLLPAPAEDALDSRLRHSLSPAQTRGRECRIEADPGGSSRVEAGRFVRVLWCSRSSERYRFWVRIP